MRLHTPCWAIPFACVFYLALPAQAEVLNVSRIATGTQTYLNYWQWESYPQLSCGTCRYSATSTAAISGSSGTALMPQAWPAPTSSSMPAPPAVQKSVPVPEGEVDNYGDTHYYDAPDYLRAQVQFSLFNHSVISDTFDGGSAAALTTYHITATNSAATTRDYFVEFQVPQKSRSVSASYTLVPGNNGGTYVYNKQKYAFSRSLVEVLVDGLPVWSQTSSYHYPDDFVGYAWDYLGIDWGSTSTERVVLYLGKIAPAAELKIDYAVATSANADISKCGTSNGSYPDQTKFHHCYRLKEERTLPSINTYYNGFFLSKLDFKIFSKELP